MKSIGIVSYNIHCNFTNYGSALQSWALCQAIGRLGCRAVLMDYCPDVLRDRNPLDPFRNMWDKDAESRRMCELTMPAIRENYEKFDRFYTKRFNRSGGVYTSENIGDCVKREGLDGFVCGSDTIFCPDEFGIDDGYYANYPCMRGRSVAYAASFGDPHFTPEQRGILGSRLNNFVSIGLRETTLMSEVLSLVSVPVERVCDPTLLLDRRDYDEIAAPPPSGGPYLLLYARRRNPDMERFAIETARRDGLRIVEISLHATNAEHGHEMRYDAGVEEFLGLVRDASAVVTNSYHGAIFAVQYNRPFSVFSREQCDTKLAQLLARLGMEDSLVVPNGVTDCRPHITTPDWDAVQSRILEFRAHSAAFLKQSLDKLTRGSIS